MDRGLNSTCRGTQSFPGCLGNASDTTKLHTGDGTTGVVPWSLRHDGITALRCFITIGLFLRSCDVYGLMDGVKQLFPDVYLIFKKKKTL